MAINVLQPDRTTGELLATGLGSGLSKGLRLLAKYKMENLQKKNFFNSLVQANIPADIANAVVNTPEGSQRTLLSSLLNSLNREQSLVVPNEKQDSHPQGKFDIYNFRRQLLNYAKKTGKSPLYLKNQLLQKGLSTEEADTLLGSKPDDKAIKYFLSKANNDPKKARMLAKKFGYEV